MPLVDVLFDWLEHAPAEAADHVLAAALDQAEPEYQARITGILLKRCTDASLGGLIGVMDRLPPDVQARVLAESQRKPGGIAAAMRSSSVRARLHAMLALEQVATPRLSYLLTYALRDGAGSVRDAAVRAGRAIAERFLDRRPPAPDADAAARRDHEVERGQLLQALREVARTYDRHFRLELLEVCLWFADDLDEPLWRLLENPRSNSGRAVQDHLKLWNGPRLAAFLLQCLKRTEWRRPAQLLLGAWQSLDAVTALLRCAPLLDDDEVRRGLGGVNRPRWFNDCGPDLGRLPADVRPLAPRWLACVGIPPEQKVQTLAAWLRSPSDALRRSAVYALAALDAPEAQRALRSCAGGHSAIGQFARWVIAGRADELLTARLHRDGGISLAAPIVPASAATTDPFADLWHTCRDAAGTAQAALLSVLQEHADLIERPLRVALAGAEARERLLALQVVGTRLHAPRFATELDALCHDPVPAIRHLSQTVLESVAPASEAVSHAERPAAGAAGRASGDGGSLARQLHELCVADAALSLDRVQAIDRVLRAYRTAPDTAVAAIGKGGA